MIRGLALLVLWPTLALANPIDAYGLGGRSSAMGGAVTADVEGPAANYYNPAGLARAPGFRIQTAWFGALHELRINGLDSNVDPASGGILGFSVPGQIDDFRFAFGLALHLPDNRVSRTRTLPRAQPRWELYDNRPQRTYLATHVAIQPVEWLSLGGGIGFLSRSDFRVDLRGTLDLVAPETGARLEHEFSGQLFTIRFPQLGAQVQPIEELCFGVVYRGQYALQNTLVTEVLATITAGDLAIPGTFFLLSESVNAFIPQQLSFGASARPLRTLRLNAEITWVNWAAYRSPIGSSEIALLIDPPPELGIDVPDELTQGQPIPAEFADRFVPRIGVEWEPYRRDGATLLLRAGYLYENSPAPTQTGFTNLVDANRHLFSAGVGVLLTDLRPLLPGRIALDLHLQYGFFPTRDHVKTSPVDPIGDLRVNGHLFAGGLSLEIQFGDDADEEDAE
jgi:long-chain fatty acid transport protein